MRLDFISFVMAFSRLTNLSLSMEAIHFDKASTFCVALEQLPKLLRSTEFHNALR